MAKAQLHLTPNDAVATELRRQAQQVDMSLNAYLMPFLHAIANKELKMTPYFPPPPPAKS